jgi:translation initiation factor IF-2
VRATFRISRIGTIAGSYIRDGIARRDALARVLRDEEEVYHGRVGSLKRFQEDVREVRTGFECGIGLEGFDDFEEGDTIVFYVKERET